MTPAELDAIEARLKAATPGPWHKVAATTEHGYGTHVVSLDEPGDGGPEDQVAVWLHGRNVAAGLSGNDADFIAHAPADVAALISEVRRLTPPPKVATWGPAIGGWATAVLRRGKRVVAYYAPFSGGYRADTGVVTDHPDEATARAYIETWAKSKGWEVRDGG